MLVEIRPIPFNNKWHGVTEGENQFTMPKVYEVYYNEKTGKYSIQRWNYTDDNFL